MNDLPSSSSLSLANAARSGHWNRFSKPWRVGEKTMIEMDLNERFHTVSLFDASKDSGDIFDDILFIRLAQWRECSKATTLSGLDSCANRIFRRFELSKNPDVLLDFWYRGFPVENESRENFAELMKLSTGALDHSQLISVAEVLGVAGEGLFPCSNVSRIDVRIDAAEIGCIQGHKVLAVWWSWLDCDQGRKFLSIYTDSYADGKIHEIHFSAPEAEMEDYADVITETLRSFQWRDVAPPPTVMQEARLQSTRH